MHTKVLGRFGVLLGHSGIEVLRGGEGGGPKPPDALFVHLHKHISMNSKVESPRGKPRRWCEQHAADQALSLGASVSLNCRAVLLRYFVDTHM